MVSPFLVVSERRRLVLKGSDSGKQREESQALPGINVSNEGNPQVGERDSHRLWPLLLSSREALALYGQMCGSFTSFSLVSGM